MVRERIGHQDGGDNFISDIEMEEVRSQLLVIDSLGKKAALWEYNGLYSARAIDSELYNYLHNYFEKKNVDSGVSSTINLNFAEFDYYYNNVRSPYSWMRKFMDKRKQVGALKDVKLFFLEKEDTDALVSKNFGNLDRPIFAMKANYFVGGENDGEVVSFFGISSSFFRRGHEEKPKIVVFKYVELSKSIVDNFNGSERGAYKDQRLCFYTGKNTLLDQFK